METVAFIGVSLLLICFFIIATLKCRKQNADNLQSCKHVPHSYSCGKTELSVITMNQIELQRVVGKGHFAMVFQGSYNGSQVAVKVIPADKKHIFNREKEIFELKLLKHVGIINVLGAGRNSDNKSLFLVLEFIEHGSLHFFLNTHKISWMLSLKLCQTLSQGLSYLHTEIQGHGSVFKPSVAHRDLSSFNVLVRADGTCVLCDFGCSTILPACSWCYCLDKEKIKMQAVHLGTVNYMSPEILEGFVNLNNSMFLMQADVYALGLLLWEIWMRCSDLFEGNAVPQHLLPYELELGTNVTLQDLTRYVSDMDGRPAVPEHWELLPQGTVLKEIMTDCWDSEPDARLTAHTVVDRFISLQFSYSL